MYVQLAVHQQHIVAFLFRTLDIRIRSIGVLGVEQNQVAVLICLILFHFRLIFVDSEILAFEVLEQCKLHGFVVEFLIGKHTELDKHLHIVPFLLKVLAVIFEYLCQFVSHLSGNIAADFLHVVVALQV